jgi:NADPH2:quinone reductase
MKAIRVEEHGGPEVLKLVDLPLPEPRAGQVRVKVAATTVNFADIQARRAPYLIGGRPPFVPGLEAAGTIDAVGEGVTGLEVGQRVTAGANGSYAEYVCTRAVEAYPLPDAVDFEEAACVPAVGITAYNLLTTSAALRPGESVLVQAAAGGMGTALVQLARAFGAGLILGTVGSEAKARLVRDLGADVAINYREDDAVARVKEATGGVGADVVFDSVGKDTFAGSLACVAPFGRLVTFGQSSGPPPALVLDQSFYGENKAIIGYSTGGNRRYRPEALRAPALAVLNLIAHNRWAPVIGARFPLEQVAVAHQLVEDRGSTGKVLLIP